MTLERSEANKSNRARLYSGLQCALVAFVTCMSTTQVLAQCGFNENLTHQKMIASDAAAEDFFGNSVSVSGNTVLVGSTVDNCMAGVNCGSAYVYRLNGSSWVEEQKLTASDAAEFDEFGSAVSVSGDTAFVGARSDDCAAGDRCGSVYVFHFNGASWVEEQKLTASDAAEGDFFGFSVS